MKSIRGRLLELALALRALLFVGQKYVCPCCGRKLRAFTRGGVSLRVRPLGYCPRCNSKARHRRIWLFLEHKTNLFTDRLHLLYVSPNYSFSRRFARMPNLSYVGLDYRDRLNTHIKANPAATPLCSNTFDAIVCVHVLEHLQDDRQAIRELYRVLKPGGWAVISVPIRLDQKTFEDPTITSPAERERAFGETVHVRFYGYDLIDRLKGGGFQVRLYPGKDIEQPIREKYALRDDENIFYCSKA